MRGLADQDMCLERVLAHWAIAQVKFHPIYPSHRDATPKMRVYLDYLATKLADRLN